MVMIELQVGGGGLQNHGGLVVWRWEGNTGEEGGLVVF